MINDLNFNVIGICKTKIDENFKFKVPGYKVYRSYRNSQGGGVAIIINSALIHSKVCLPQLS